MASKRQLARFIFKLDRKLVKEQKALASTLYKEMQKQLEEIVANDGTFHSNTFSILMDAYLKIGLEFANKQFNALTTGDYTKANDFFLEYWKEWIDKFVSIRVAEKVKNIDGYTVERFNDIKAQIKRVVAESVVSVPNVYIAEQLRKKLGAGVLSKGRAMTIARTETSAIANEAKAKSAESWAGENGQRQFKMWVHRASKQQRDNHAFLDGLIIPVEEKFQVVAENGLVDYMDYPHDPSGSAANVINCNCQVVYVSEDYVNQL